MNIQVERPLSHGSIAVLQEQLHAFMKSKQLKSTSKRRLVAELFFQGAGHQTIDDLLTMARARDRKIGYVTVYRTMKLLVECGLANECNFGRGASYFEIALAGRHHDHLICLGCNEIIEFEDDDIERSQEAVAERAGFKLVTHKHELYGVCPGCLEPAA